MSTLTLIFSLHLYKGTFSCSLNSWFSESPGFCFALCTLKASCAEYTILSGPVGLYLLLLNSLPPLDMLSWPWALSLSLLAKWTRILGSWKQEGVALMTNSAASALMVSRPSLTWGRGGSSGGVGGGFPVELLELGAGLTTPCSCIAHCERGTPKGESYHSTPCIGSKKLHVAVSLETSENYALPSPRIVALCG